jgi:hypothetical protein
LLALSLSVGFTCAYRPTERRSALDTTYSMTFTMEVPNHDCEKTQPLGKRAGILECLDTAKAIQESHASLGLCTLKDLFIFSADTLDCLLEMWMDCPSSTREMLTPGSLQFKEISKTATMYEGMKLPLFHFFFTCESYVCALEEEESIVGSGSALITAWNGLQFLIHVINA